jgi:hypothetical protein
MSILAARMRGGACVCKFAGALGFGLQVSLHGI